LAHELLTLKCSKFLVVLINIEEKSGMNKKLVTIAVVAALMPAAAMAEVTVYGRIHASVDSLSGIAAEKNNVSVNNNSSRFGVKGNQALDGGLTALYQIEASVAATGDNGSGTGTAASAFNGVRDTYVGLTGGFGTFLTGRLPAANQYVYDTNMFADQLGDAGNFIGGSLAGVGRANSALHYVSPSMGGLNIALTYLPAKSTISSTGIAAAGNSTGIKVNYAGNGITASLTTFNVNVGTGFNVKPVSIAGGYDFGPGSLSAQYISATNEAGADTKRTIINVGGKFRVSESDAIKAQFTKAGDKTAAGATVADGATMLAVGYDHALSKVTGVYVVYAKVSNNAAGTYSMNGWGHQNQAAAVAVGDNPSGFSVGLTHNF
jgi:predicted porin